MSADQVTLLRPDEVAIVLNVSVDTLRTWRTKRTGPPYVKLNPQTVRYVAELVHEWMLTRAQTTARAFADKPRKQRRARKG